MANTFPDQYSSNLDFPVICSYDAQPVVVPLRSDHLRRELQESKLDSALLSGALLRGESELGRSELLFPGDG